MKSQYIFNKYKACIHNAKAAFSHYDKYHSCFSIRSVDEEMLGVIRKIGLSYAKLMQLVFNHEKNIGHDRSAVLSIDECENMMKEEATFFNHVTNFLEGNEEEIKGLLDDKAYAGKIQNDLDVLENNLNYANKLVDRMDLMLKASQQIYLRQAIVNTTLKSA